MKFLTAMGVCIMLAGHIHAALTDAQLQEVAFDQHPGRELPMQAAFVDADGASIKLGDCFRGTPVLLVPGYFRCRMLCEGVSDGLIRALQGSRKEAGRDFRVVFVSIDPKEPPAEARAKKATFLKRYARAGAEGGCQFLTGAEADIRQVTDAIGYRYVYDPQSGEFAHPAGFVVVRPNGKIFRYFFGIVFDSGELDKAIADAAREDSSPSLAQQLMLLCFHYNPIRSPYGAVILNAVRVLALATLAGLVFLIVRTGRRRRNPQK